MAMCQALKEATQSLPSAPSFRIQSPPDMNKQRGGAVGMEVWPWMIAEGEEGTVEIERRWGPEAASKKPDGL